MELISSVPSTVQSALENQLWFIHFHVKPTLNPTWYTVIWGSMSNYIGQLRQLILRNQHDNLIC